MVLPIVVDAFFFSSSHSRGYFQQLQPIPLKLYKWPIIHTLGIALCNISYSPAQIDMAFLFIKQKLFPTREADKLPSGMQS